MDRLVIPVLTPAAAPVIADLAARPDVQVVAAAVEVGGETGVERLRGLALSAGARSFHTRDCREALAAEVLWPAVRAGALAVPGEPVLTALSMPMVARAVVDVARVEQASGVACWADDPRDRQRLRALVRSVAPDLGLVGVSSSATAATTRNVWARVDAAEGPRPPVPPPPATADLRIGFEAGQPVSLDGEPLVPLTLIARLDALGRTHGAGRWHVRGSATASSWDIDAPAALMLGLALHVHATRSLDARTAEVAATMAETFAEVIRDGAWFSPVRAGLDAFFDRVLADTAGEVGLRISDGRIEVQA